MPKRITRKYPGQLYDAYVLYQGDTVLGVFDSMRDIAKFTGKTPSQVGHWMTDRDRTDKLWHQGKIIKHGYVVEPVRFDNDDLRDIERINRIYEDGN